MARVLCINPWIYDFAAYNLWVEPLGLLSIAATLRHAGHQVTLIDCLDRHHPHAPAPCSPRDAYGCGQFPKVELPKPPPLAHVPRRWGRYGLPLHIVRSELRALPRPDAVLVTSLMTYWYPGPFEAIRLVKAQWPGVPVALGGIYATLCTDHARAHSGADALFAGQAERAVLAWVARIAGRPCPPAPLPDHIPPAHDLRRSQGYAAILTARGCPFDCPYCAVGQLCGPGWRGRDPAHVVAEIAWCAERLGARDIAFYDDALTFDADRHLVPILDRLLARGLNVRFHTPNGLHARFIDRPLADKMRRAGFITIRLGLETADPVQQAHDGGKVDRDAFAGAVNALFEAGFAPGDVAAYVLAGRPEQPVGAVRETVAYAHQLGVPVQIAQFSPIPGTVEWESAVSAGCIAPDADPLLHNNSLYPCGRAAEWERLKIEVRAANRKLLTR